MLHRITVRLYDENPLDAEVLDALAHLEGKLKQDMLRTLLRIGYKVMNGSIEAQGATAAVLLSDIEQQINTLKTPADRYERVQKQDWPPGNIQPSKEEPISNVEDSVSLDELLTSIDKQGMVEEDFYNPKLSELIEKVSPLKESGKPDNKTTETKSSVTKTVPSSKDDQSVDKKNATESIRDRVNAIIKEENLPKKENEKQTPKEDNSENELLDYDPSLLEEENENEDDPFNPLAMLEKRFN